MSETTQTQEPSMEEILASIRRIISEDGATVEPTQAEEPAPAAAAAEEAPILDLVEEVKEDGSIASVEDISFDPVPAAQPAVVPVIDLEDPVPVSTINLDADSLISETTAQASASALSGLSRMMNSGVNVTSQPIGDGHKTLESMVLELLRPILKDWLDRNLPTLVEKIVQKEIQKITRNLQ